MNWDSLGAIGTILGAIAVFVTLVYLARQISESNKLASSAMANEVARSFADFNEMIVANAQVADLFSRLTIEGGEFNASEEVQVQHLAYRLFNIYSQGQIAYDNGHIDDGGFQGLKDDCKAQLQRYPGLISYFLDVLKTLPTMNYEVFEYVLARGTKSA